MIDKLILISDDGSTFRITANEITIERDGVEIVVPTVLWLAFGDFSVVLEALEDATGHSERDEDRPPWADGAGVTEL